VTDIIALDGPLQLVPVVALEPARFSREARDVPIVSVQDDPAAWYRYWKDSLADAHIDDIEPISHGSWWVATRTLTDKTLPVLLHELLLDHQQRIDVEGIGMLFGGYALLHEDTVVIEHTCCTDFGDIAEWEHAAAYRRAEWKDIWIGHPQTCVRFDRGRLLLSDLRDDGTVVAKFSLEPAMLAKAVAQAKQECVTFIRRCMSTIEQDDDLRRLHQNLVEAV